MRIVCPNCATSYEVGEGAIPQGGRQVQCSSCDQVWFQSAVVAEASPAEVAVSTASDESQSTASDIEPEVTPTFVSRRDGGTQNFDRDLAQELAAEAPQAPPDQTPPEQPAATEFGADTDVASSVEAASETLAEEATDLAYRGAAGLQTALAGGSDVTTELEQAATALAFNEPPEFAETGVEDAFSAAARELEEQAAEAVEMAADTELPETFSDLPSEALESAAEFPTEIIEEASGATIAETIAETTSQAYEDAAAEGSELLEDAAALAEDTSTSSEHSGAGALGAVAAAAATTTAAIGSTARLKSYGDMVGDATSRARNLTELDNDALTRSLRDQIQEAEEAEGELDDGYTHTKFEPTQRKAALPDANELNSSLRQNRTERKIEPVKYSGFLTGFLIALILGCLAVALYMFAPRLAEAMPQLEGPLVAYVEFCNMLRDQVTALIRPEESAPES